MVFGCRWTKIISNARRLSPIGCSWVFVRLGGTRVWSKSTRATRAHLPSETRDRQRHDDAISRHARSAEICERQGIDPEDVTDHFHLEFEMPDEILQLTKPARPTPYTPASVRLRNEVAELNAFFADHSVEGANVQHIGGFANSTWPTCYPMRGTKVAACIRSRRCQQPTISKCRKPVDWSYASTGSQLPRLTSVPRISRFSIRGMDRS